jgi:hypothetical protein
VMANTRERRTRLPEPWRRVDGGRGKLGARYVGPAGYVIENCGHPTALWPYALIEPGGRLLVAANGYAFRNLELAAAEVARIQRGGAPRFA